MEDESDMMDQQQEYVEGDMMDEGYDQDMMDGDEEQYEDQEMMDEEGMVSNDLFLKTVTD
jgi:hypothetical protein